MPNIAPMNMLKTLMPMLQQGQQQGQEQQAPDPTEMVNQVIAQFRQHLEKQKQAGKLTAPLALGGESGTKPVQQPVGISPYESAGQMRSARTEGVENFMGQAAEQAGKTWKPQALDIGLMAATIALPIIAAMQPEGRGRRGLRKQQRKSTMFKALGELAGKGLGARRESFQAGREATYEAAESRAERLGEESQAQYEHEIGGIEAAESKRRWGKEFGLAERGMAVRELPKPGKPLFTPGQLYQQGRNVAADAHREQAQMQKDTLVKANQITRSIFGMEFVINSVQDLDEAIYSLEHGETVPFSPVKGRFGQMQGILQQLRNLRDQYYGGETPMLPMGDGQTGKPPDMTDAEWQEYLQMKGR